METTYPPKVFFFQFQITVVVAQENGPQRLSERRKKDITSLLGVWE